MRRESADGSRVLIEDRDLGRALSLDRKKRTATMSESSKPTKEKPADLYAELFDISSDVRVESKDAVVGGHPALAFETRHDSWSRISWIDEKSRRPVLVKYSFHSKTKPPTEAVWEKFQYDQKLDASLFDLGTPKGYTEVEQPPSPKINVYQ
jgi:outer membrane lipoprotein-sorting protein